MSNPNAAQAEYWSANAGQKWLDHESALDASMAGILQRLFERTNIRPGEHLLDVGCGTGVSTCEAASLTTATGNVIGLDISELLLGRARVRSQNAGLGNTRFILADAQTHAFERNSYDAIFSRFGMMFFDDPVAAFANMATSLKPGGRLVFATWGPLSENPWFHIPASIARQRLGTPVPTEPTAPGPLAFQDIDRIIGVLKQAGLTQVQATNETVRLTTAGTNTDVARLAIKVGPAVRIIKEFSGSKADTIAIEKAIGLEFQRFETATGTHIPASINFFSASAPADTIYKRRSIRPIGSADKEVTNGRNT
ncbi:MAG: class I SAM-dependent methyltransferase [Paracoccaceae bacterium]